jgi:hypothetical protein
LSDGDCVVVSEAACAAVDGEYQGDDTTCAPGLCERQGACCFPDGSCQLLLQDECDAAGGDYLGDGTSCAPNLCPPAMGACCLDGGCGQASEAFCDVIGGVYEGGFTNCHNVDCSPVGACCLTNGSCQTTSQADCANAGGSFLGAGTDCKNDGGVCAPPIGACCFPNGTCSLLTGSACIEKGGEPQGDGTFCKDAVCKAPPPVNDSCLNAIDVSPPATAIGSTAFATADAVPPCGGLPGDVGVWYRVQGTGTKITISTCGSDVVDTRLAVFCGPCHGLSCVISNDDGCGQRSQLHWCSQATAEYLILVSTASGTTGNFELTVSADGQPCADPAQCIRCGDPQTGNCFNDLGPGQPACNNAACCEFVCGIDPFCCSVTWDQLCVTEALKKCGNCGSPVAGDCFTDTRTVGCDDAMCCETVCGIDAYCCHVMWDSICADQALDICPQPEPQTCAGDANVDGVVDLEDMLIVITDMRWYGESGTCAGDVTEDGVCSVLDLVAVIMAWGACDSP